MLTLEQKRQLTCTRCGKLQEMFCQIVYSQGDRVCLECKEKSEESDKRAFDRDMGCRNRLY